MSASFTLSDRLKIVRLFVFDGATTAFRHISFNPLMFWRLSGPTAEELLIAPQDIQTTDPTLANEFYSGYFSFAGKTANCSGVSPFEIIPPSEAWYRELVEFGWLRHLRASRTEISRVQARVHVDDWIRLDSKPTSRAWNVESTATRVMSWLCHSPLLLEGCEHPFYRRFMKSLTRQERYLRLMYKDAPPGLPRLKAAIALSYASVCIAGYDNQVKSAGKRLSRELENQILPDGGHISRNPEAIIRILALLLPLRQAILTRNFVPEQALIDAIDRMMPMLRFFRMGDGNFAHFNGMGDTPADLIATMLAYDDTAASPVLNAPHSGYQRFQINDTTMVMDTGALPPEGVSSDAHAGCLSFELSCGRDRIVVNCGRPGHRVVGNDGTVWLQLARSTAIHSTLSINDQSSCRFLESERLDRTRGVPVLSGPKNVKADRKSEEGAVTVTASHDGYVPSFGLKHVRTVSLTSDGNVFSGHDSLLTAKDKQVAPGNKNNFQLRFHLHPAVSAFASSSRTIELSLPSGKRWLFSSLNADVGIEDSIALADVFGSKNCKQIVIEGQVGELPQIDWVFQRLS